jgi:seryl-tRNA synthetase
MLDINFIRENLEIVKMGAKKKHIEIDLDKLVEVDDKRRELLQKFEEKKAEQNKISKEIGQASPEEREKLIAGVGALKEEVQKLENELKEVMKE